MSVTHPVEGTHPDPSLEDPSPEACWEGKEAHLEAPSCRVVAYRQGASEDGLHIVSRDTAESVYDIPPKGGGPPNGGGAP